MTIANLCEKLLNARADGSDVESSVRIARIASGDIGTLCCQEKAIQPIPTYPPIQTYPPTYHVVSSSKEKELSPDRIALRAFSLPCACVNNNAINRSVNDAHIYNRAEQKLSKLSEQHLNPLTSKGCDRIGRSKSSQKLSRPILAPGRATILKYCRCIDCPHWIEAKRIKQYYCRALIPTAAAPDQWHWCAGYGGPTISKETLVWKYNKTA